MSSEKTSAAGDGTVLITGVSGLIGARVAEKLSERHHIVGMDIKPPQAPPQSVEFINTDLTDDESVRAALAEIRQRSGERIASVIHLAAYYDFSGEPSPLYDKLTVQGTRRMLHALQAFAVEQFVFSSSLLVMQPTEGEWIDENSPTRAEWDYPQSKLDAERVIASERGNVPAVVLRIAGVYDEDCHSLPISQQISRIYERKLESHMFPGNRDRGQAFVHLDDLTECFARVVERRAQLGPHELFLIAEPDVMSYGELQDGIGELLHGKEWTTIRIPKVVAKVGAWVQDKLAPEGEEPFIKPWMVDLADQHYAADITRARTKLGWEPRHRLRDTLPEIARRLKQDPRRWYAENGLRYPDDAEA
ncbi:MAG: NAD(P)-dependent oxidoreductase [Planctomycetales bacterium]